VNFKNGTVWSIAYFGVNSLVGREHIQGIKLGDSENRVREKFGVPSSSVSSDDRLRRLYHYSSYNLIFELVQNKVTGRGIYSPEAAPSGVKFAPGKDEARK
jgi:hypothetical protein